MEASFTDSFGQVVREGDVIIWTPSEGNGLALRRVLSITSTPFTVPYGSRKGETQHRVHVKVCPPGHEHVLSTHRTINHRNAVRWPNQDAKTDRG